jgi:hypothetical protein
LRLWRGGEHIAGAYSHCGQHKGLGNEVAQVIAMEGLSLCMTGL